MGRGERIRAIVVLAVACAATWVGAGPVGAQQPEIDLSPGLELTLAGEAGKAGQRDARLSGWIDHRGTDGHEGPLPIGGSLTLPRGLSFHGAAFPRCSGETIREVEDTSGCPRRSLLGRGVGRGFADRHAAAAVVDGFTSPTYEFVNGGPRLIWAAMTIYTPALVREPMALDLRKQPGRGWSRRIDFEFPAILRVIAGIPINVRSLDLMLDGLDRAPGYLTFDGSCPKRHRLPYRASLTFLNDDGTATEASRRGRLSCRMARRT